MENPPKIVNSSPKKREEGNFDKGSTSTMFPYYYDGLNLKIDFSGEISIGFLIPELILEFIDGEFIKSRKP